MRQRRTLLALGLTLALGGAVILGMRASAAASIASATAAHALVIRGTITRSDLGWAGARVDAIGDPYDAHCVVQFAVEAVPKGSWDRADFGLLLHSPTMAFFPGGGVGSRRLIFLDRAPQPDGGSYLRFEESRPCSWPLSPCP